MSRRPSLTGVFVCALVAVSPVAAIEVIDVDPRPHSLSAPVDTEIRIRFDRPVDPASVTVGPALSAFGRWSGPVTGTYRFEEGDRVAVLEPTGAFSAGESVMVLLSEDVSGADGSPFRDGGYTFRFWTRAQPVARQFTQTQDLSTRSIPVLPVQSYGGIGSDLDGDGHLDITVVNEISSDLRVFMNRADGAGNFDAFLQPTFPVGVRASPSEPADFDRDGHVDICVANIGDDSVSILLGNGDGTFAPQQKIAVGSSPRGIAVLDADGDGWVDIVNTNSGTVGANMTLLLNDGSGGFGAPLFFAAGAAGTWALAAADMNEDGLLDLVVGAQTDQQILVMIGNGDGTFTAAPSQVAGGRVWMLVTGDVDGDGDEDVAAVNGRDDSAALLRGDGTGGLAAPELTAVDPFALATDLGDLDGDGDLDWITSSFSGDWMLFVNDGTGSFALDQEFAPTGAASCALVMDVDNDGDTDLALIDKSADRLQVENNRGASAITPPAVPAGGSGRSPLTVAKLAPGGDDLRVAFDDDGCAGAVTYHLVFGGGSDLPSVVGGSLTVDGSVCGIVRAPFDWLASPDPNTDPSGMMWFLVLADDGATVEGSWGRDGSGNERIGPGPAGSSGECAISSKDLTSSCGL